MKADSPFEKAKTQVNLTRWVRVETHKWMLRLSPGSIEHPTRTYPTERGIFTYPSTPAFDGASIKADGTCKPWWRDEAMEVEVNFHRHKSKEAIEAQSSGFTSLFPGDDVMGEFLGVCADLTEGSWQRLWDKALLAESSFITFKIEVGSEIVPNVDFPIFDLHIALLGKKSP